LSEKKRHAVYALVLLAILARLGSAAIVLGPPTGTSVYTLNPDQEILRSESTIDGKPFGPFESSFGSSLFWYPKSTNDLYSVVFSDGQSFPSPLDIMAVKRQGKTVFRWITLEDNRKIVVYERAI
jgi:hypothetical protein